MIWEFGFWSFYTLTTLDEVARSLSLISLQSIKELSLNLIAVLSSPGGDMIGCLKLCDVSALFICRLEPGAPIPQLLACHPGQPDDCLSRISNFGGHDKDLKMVRLWIRWCTVDTLSVSGFVFRKTNPAAIIPDLTNTIRIWALWDLGEFVKLPCSMPPAICHFHVFPHANNLFVRFPHHISTPERNTHNHIHNVIIIV